MWEIFAYQNADSLFGVFNAAAAIHASADYRAAAAAVAFFGFVAALVAYAFAPEKLQGWKWLATVLIVFSLLILPKASVGIVDKTGGAPVKVVDNVPLGVALLGSVSSTVGHTLTGLFETAFQVIPGPGALPAELTYERNGLMFGHRLIRETGSVVFQDPNFRTDLLSFLQNCTAYDLIDGSLDPAAFATSADTWALMANPNPARFSTLTTAGAVGVETCPTVYANLNGRMPAQLSRIEGKLAFQLNPTLPTAIAAGAIAGQIQQAYLRNGIADAAATSADLIRQNAILNAVNDAGRLAGQRINDPAAMVLAVGRAQAVSQQNATWLNQGKIAEQALPVFRNVIEAITYALFPLFVLLLLLTSGRESMLAIKGYAAILIWIQLWPPLYAVLNYMASVYAAYDIAAAADLGTGTRSLALQTASSIYSRTLSGEAMVGYLAISIPFISWAAVKRMENFGTALVGGLSALQGTVTSSTAGAAAGNVSLGNVAMDQMQLAPNRTSAFMSSAQNDLSGNTLSSNVLTGRTAASLLRNQGFASHVVSMRVSEQDVTEASKAADAARSEAIAAATDRSSVVANAFMRGVSTLRSKRQTSGTATSAFEQYGEATNRLDQIVRNISDTTGLSQSQVATIAFGAEAHLGLSTPVAGAGVRGNAGKSYAATMSGDQRKVLGQLTNEQASEFKQYADRISRDRSFAEAVSNDRNQASELSSRLSTAQSRSQRAMATYGERLSFTERLSSARERGETMSIDIAQDPQNLEAFLRYSERYGGNSAAALVLFESELARRAAVPAPVFTDGSARPKSFKEMPKPEANGAAAPLPDIDLDDAFEQNSRTIGEQATPQVDNRPAVGLAIGREEIAEEASTMRERARNGADALAVTNAKRDSDGRPIPSQSLLVKAGKQVVDDASGIAEEASRVVKRLTGNSRQREQR